MHGCASVNNSVPLSKQSSLLVLLSFAIANALAFAFAFALVFHLPFVFPSFFPSTPKTHYFTACSFVCHDAQGTTYTKKAPPTPTQSLRFLFYFISLEKDLTNNQQHYAQKHATILKEQPTKMNDNRTNIHPHKHTSHPCTC